MDTDDIDALVSAWLPLPDIAERLDERITTVRQWLQEGRLLALRRGDPPVLQVPAELVGEAGPVKGLPGTITVLRDNGYSDGEALRWLFTVDDTLPGRPIDALRENRGTEVKRRAQALGF